MSRDEFREEALDEWARMMNEEFADLVQQPDPDFPFYDSNYDLRAVRPRTTGWYVFDDGFWTGPYRDEGEATAAVCHPSNRERFAADAVIVNVTRA